MRSSTAFLILAPVLVLSACAPEPAAPPEVPAVDIAAEEEAIRAVSTRWLELARQRDAAGIAALFADDGRLIWTGQDPVVGPAAIQEFIASDFEANPMQTFDWSTDRVEVAASGDLAVEYGTSYMTAYRKMNGSWMVVADASVDAP